MRFLEALCNHEAPTFPGVRDRFQVVELTEQDEDVSYLVDQGTHFNSVKQLEQHLTSVTGDDVDVREVSSSSAPEP